MSWLHELDENDAVGLIKFDWTEKDCLRSLEKFIWEMKKCCGIRNSAVTSQTCPSSHITADKSEIKDFPKLTLANSLSANIKLNFFLTFNYRFIK